jgi:hypothetical protein
MTSSSASDHGNPAGIAALMQKGTTSKGMEANINFAKWLSCGIQISGTFGLHHVYLTVLNTSADTLIDHVLWVLPVDEQFPSLHAAEFNKT